MATIKILPYLLSDQLDLWTQRASGCTCPDDVLDHTCACCVSNGCQCAGLKPQRCGQCGLEQYCDDSKYIMDLKIWKVGQNEVKMFQLLTH